MKLKMKMNLLGKLEAENRYVVYTYSENWFLRD